MSHLNYKELALVGIIGCASLFSGCDRNVSHNIGYGNDQDIECKNNQDDLIRSMEYHRGSITGGRFEFKSMEKKGVYDSLLKVVNVDSAQIVNVEAKGDVPLYKKGNVDIIKLEYVLDKNKRWKYERGKSPKGHDGMNIEKIVSREGGGYTTMTYLLNFRWAEIQEHIEDCEGKYPCKIALKNKNTERDTDCIRTTIQPMKRPGKTSALDELF